MSFLMPGKSDSHRLLPRGSASWQQAPTQHRMRPVCDRALQGRVVSVFVFPAPRTLPARSWPARPQGQHGPAAATGPSSGLITQEYAWKKGMGTGGAGGGLGREDRKRCCEAAAARNTFTLTLDGPQTRFQRPFGIYGDIFLRSAASLQAPLQVSCIRTSRRLVFVFVVGLQVAY